MIRFFPYTLSLILLIFLYYETVTRLIRGSFSWENSHSLLILAICFYMIWMKRHQFSRLSMKPNIFLGSGLTALGCLIFLFGKLSNTWVIQDISIVVTLLGLIWLLWGTYYFKALLIPVGYLFFVFPLFHELLGNISIYFQYVTAWIAYTILKILGMPVLLSAQFIELPHITLEVASACNGINHIMALIALSVPLAFFTQKTFLKKMSLFLFAFLIGILANGFRVALIGIWSAYKKGGPLHGPNDLFYVSFIFFFGMALLLLISHLMGKTRSSSLNPQTSNRKPQTSANLLTQSSAINTQSTACYALCAKPSFSGNNSIPQHHSTTAPKNIPYAIRLTSFLIAFFILVITLGFLHYFKPIPTYLKIPLSSIPTTIETWEGQDITTKNLLIQNKADENINRIYKNISGENIYLSMGYFASQQKGKEITDFRFQWNNAKYETTSISLGENEVKIIKMIPHGKDSHKIIYFWYYINGKILSHHYEAKLGSFLNLIKRQKNNGAVVAITSDLKQMQNEDFKEDVLSIKFIQVILPVIQKHLKNI